MLIGSNYFTLYLFLLIVSHDFNFRAGLPTRPKADDDSPCMTRHAGEARRLSSRALLARDGGSRSKGGVCDFALRKIFT